jgi:hypothetical protein
MTLPDTLAIQLLTLIEKSVVERYSGELGRREDPLDAGSFYLPIDTDAIRDLLNDMWGEHVTKESIDHVYTNLVENGAEEWPKAYCEEDLQYERDQRLSSIDNDIERAEEYVAKLKRERDGVIEEGPEAARRE